MAETLFRQEALDKLSSPEQLDQLMSVSSPRALLAVLAFAVLLVALGAWSLYGSLPVTVDGSAILLRKGSVHRVQVLDSGLITSLKVKVGDQLEEGQVIGTLKPIPATDQALEEIKTVKPGIVVKKAAAEGDMVQPGATLLFLEPQNPALDVVAYLPLLKAKAVHKNMVVQVSPSDAPREVYGFLWGRVRWVSQFPSQSTGMLDTLGNEELVKYFLASQAAPVEIHVDLTPDATTPSGYAWSSGRGPAEALQPETLCTATIVLSSQPPISLLIPQAGP